MAFSDDDIAEHISEVFGDIRLGRREGRAVNGYRYFRRSMRTDELYRPSERYRAGEPWPATISLPAVLPRVACECGRTFGSEHGLNAHVRRYCKARR
jgi:hypothetical protein